MKQVLIKQGQAVVEDIPAPVVSKGMLLVRVCYSCISIGTEMASVKTSGLPLWKKVLQEPNSIKKALNLVSTHGFKQTGQLVKNTLKSGKPTGYSAAGTVIEVGEGIDDIRPGDRVACAGAQCAHHAEIICIPRNLAVPLPRNITFPEAATVTLGAIALQGVRRSNPTIGENYVVLGLGILGQLTAQILKANGCQVTGIDINKTRIQLAQMLGMNNGFHPEEEDINSKILKLTEGIGADCVIITAASQSDHIVSTAFQMCRKKGRVILVGDVGLDLNRNDLYLKELDFLISTSYGPGRYDRKYEEEGQDYPVAYVRWTENRNMDAYLKLVANKQIQIEPLIEDTYTIDEAGSAYEKLNKDEDNPLMVLLSYPQAEISNAEISREVIYPKVKQAEPGRIRIAVIGAGSFAQAMHLPNLQDLSNFYHIQAVSSRTGHKADAIARRFGANYSTTDYRAILNDPEVDAVLIATRHNLHSEMALEALQAGKHVLVEKPLALHQEELNKIIAFYSSNHEKELPILFTGFNRRFSPFLRQIKENIGSKNDPMIINYIINAGHIPLDNWVHTQEGGGRNIGEACHIYDLFTYLTNSKVVTVNVQSIKPATSYYSHKDNFVATIVFDDGSVATLTYTALGSAKYPKEKMTIYSDGNVLELDDYTRLTITGQADKKFKAKMIDKGQKEELVAFADAINKGNKWPIPLWQQIQATEISFEVEQFLSTN